MATPYIRHVHSAVEMATLLKENSVVVVSFHATWSAPCREIAPHYSQLATKYRSLTFVKVEVNPDNIQSVGQKCRLTELPTFVVIKNEEEIDRIRGVDQKGLEGMIVKHAPMPKPTASGAGSANAGDANDSSLLEYLDMSQVYCLNEAQDHTLKSVVEKKRRNATDAYLESDADEQLLITLRFNQTVKVRSIVLHTKDPKFGPKDIKIDINKPALDFDDMESATELGVVQMIELSKDLVKEGNPIQLRFVRLQRVSSLHIFVGSNHGHEDVTRIDAIDVYGPSDDQPATTTQISGLRNFLEVHWEGMDSLHLFERGGGIQSLFNSVLLLREALLLCPTGHQERAMIFGNLSIALILRYMHQGDYSDLVEAISFAYELLGLHPLGHPYRAKSLGNLSTALLTRYEREGSLADLSEATERAREALELHPLLDSDRAKSHGNLSKALLTRYQREGSLADLSEATERAREALELHPPGHLDRAKSLGNLSTALFTRYRREGSLADLSEATERYREALELRPLGHPERAASLNNLSSAFLHRYEHEGSLADLSEATERYREALELHPLGHPDRTSSLNNLSMALLTRYHREGSLADLSEATEHLREALELRPLGHPHRAINLDNLSNALLTRHRREGSPADLSEATERYREALELRPLGHPHRTRSLSSLSHVLLLAIGREIDAASMQGYQTLPLEAFEALREATGLPSCPPRHRLEAALQWIDAAGKLAPESTLDAYWAALDLLDIVLATSSTLEDKRIQLSSSKDFAHCKRLGVEAASYAVSHGHVARAVELMERGRNLLFAQVGRYRVELEELRKVNVELADQFHRLSGLLDASVVSNQVILEGQTAFEDPTERYRRVSADWNQAVEDIRNVEGFNNFLKAPDYATLRTAAAEGPVIIVIPSAEKSDALIISRDRDEPHHVVLPEAGEAELAELRRLLIKAMGAEDERTTEKSVKKILGSLWDLVVGPIANALEKELRVPLLSRIWWCPTSLFSFLPLHAAGHYTYKDANQNLPDRYVSSYTPTLRALTQAQLNHSIGGRAKMLIVAQPDTPGQAPLPNALEEAGLVEDLVGAGMETALISRAGGTRTAVLEGMAGHSWLHLVCHGVQSSDNPFQSCFSLYNGKLTLQDVMRSGLPDARFAYLAACHTATGDDQLSDEGLHLAAGLQFAGFKGVVGTTWKVADEDGPLVARAFYRALLEEGREGQGMDCSRAAYALNRAVKQLRADGAVKVNSLMRFIHIGI